ncbi:hypothetical protein JCM10207_007959 [Rhodosporidiobolus poonsookiae]
MAHLSNDDFLTRLATLFGDRKAKGSVFLTQKRLTYEPTASTSDAPVPAEGDVEMADAPAADDEREWPLLVRATDGQGKKDIKVKLSTVVQPADFDTFTAAYSSLLRVTFASGLRPKRKRAAGEGAKKLKRKGASASAAGGAGAEAGAGFVARLPKVVGPRRGNGREKRKRLERRREKAVERFRAVKQRRAAAAGAAE